MYDARNLLDKFLGTAGAPDPSSSGTTPPDTQAGSALGNLTAFATGPGGLATGAVAGGLVGLLVGGKNPKKLAVSAMKLGGAALVGGLAYKAYNNWRSSKSNTPSQPEPTGKVLESTGFLPTSEVQQNVLCKSLVCAMIAAAKADGHISEKERQSISQQLTTSDLTGHQRQFIEEQLSNPLDIDALADMVTSPAQAAEMYTASLLVIDDINPAERGYLGMLAARLNLDPDLVEHLHANVRTIEERQAA